MTKDTATPTKKHGVLIGTIFFNFFRGKTALLLA